MESNVLQEIISNMQEHQRGFRRDIDKMSNDVTQIKEALIGNPLVKDSGMVFKLAEIEKTIEKQEEEINKLRDDRIRNNVYMKIIIVIGSAILIALARDFVKNWLN
jgi:hypothetical protein